MSVTSSRSLCSFITKVSEQGAGYGWWGSEVGGAIFLALFWSPLFFPATIYVEIFSRLHIIVLNSISSSIFTAVNRETLMLKRKIGGDEAKRMLLAGRANLCGTHRLILYTNWKKRTYSCPHLHSYLAFWEILAKTIFKEYLITCQSRIWKLTISHSEFKNNKIWKSKQILPNSFSNHIRSTKKYWLIKYWLRGLWVCLKKIHRFVYLQGGFFPLPLSDCSLSDSSH